MASKERRRRAKKQRQSRKTHSQPRPVQERDDPGPREYTLRHRATKLSEILIAYPQQIALGLAAREDAGWVFGRLYLVGAIDYDQKAAAERLSAAVANYRKLLHKRYGASLTRAVTTPLGPVFDAERIGGNSSQEDLSPTTEKRFERAKKEFDRHMEILQACGEDVEKAVIRALEKDALTDLVLVSRGLSALCALRAKSTSSDKKVYALSDA